LEPAEDRPIAFLPYGRQTIEDDDIAAVVATLKSDFLTTGPAVEAFEQAFAAYVGTDHAVALSSGTAALHLAALALGLGPGDAVVVPSVTFVATANVVRHVGADVIFADVDPDTGLMGPAELESALDRAEQGTVRAVFPVHLNGQPCNMAAIADVARANGLEIVEDACHALGGTIGAQSVGDASTSRMAMFSLHPVKAIAMGEGGVLTTNDSNCSQALRRFRNHGLVQDSKLFRDPVGALDAAGQPNPWYYELHEPGLNYRASDIHCSLGLTQLAKLDRFLARRRDIAARYDELLAPLAPLVQPVPRVPWGNSGWHLYPVLINFEATGVSRAELMRALAAEGIGSQVHYIPVHRQPYYRAIDPELSLTGADAYYARCLSLPFFPAMADTDVERVIAALDDILGASV
jgi:UDP-4-amino-4,6-dideoxy-N-acetyl-beta-L-altrosamine transaminase